MDTDETRIFLKDPSAIFDPFSSKIYKETKFYAGASEFIYQLRLVNFPVLRVRFEFTCCADKLFRDGTE